MLRLASSNSCAPVHYVCMDMCRMAFTQKFDSIIIPYNTTNLLHSESKIINCFKLIHELLQTHGTLLFQINIPGTNMFKKEGEKCFQFQIFSLPDNKGKLIKETIRSFSGQTQTLQLEERYRVRGTQQNPLKEDLKHTLQLAAFSLEKWISILSKTGFQIISLFGDYDNRPFNNGKDSLLLIKAKKITKR